MNKFQELQKKAKIAHDLVSHLEKSLELALINLDKTYGDLGEYNGLNIEEFTKQRLEHKET